MGQVLLTPEEPHERPPLLALPDPSPEDRVHGLERVQDRPLRDRPLQLELHLPLDARQRPQVVRQHDPYHGSVCIFTDRTAGRSRTMGPQVSPASGDA